MVVIESAVTQEHSNVNANPAARDVNKDRTMASGSNRDASDGFETASDGEIAESDNVGEGENAAVHGSQERKQEEKNDEESKQRALEEANEAKLQGNNLFGNGQYEEALKQYELALQVAADIPSSVELRSICHANRAICFLKLVKYEDTIKECTKALELNPSYLKALIRRGEAHEKLENYEEAFADLKKILELDPSNEQARKTIRRLEPMAAEKREKMKEEMIGKLKDMGNSILGRFGMSVDNFKAVKDPNTGSYSVSFQR